MDIQMEIQVKKQILFISFFPVCDASDFVRDHVGDVHLQVENPSTWPEGYAMSGTAHCWVTVILLPNLGMS